MRAAAAKLGTAPQALEEDPGDEVRIAFDGDAVVFSDEFAEVFKLHGLHAFLKHERENAKTPMSGGPFRKAPLRSGGSTDEPPSACQFEETL